MITSKQQFYGVLFANGLNKKDYETKEDLFCDALDKIKSKELVEYIIENYPKRLTDRTLTIIAEQYDVYTFRRALDESSDVNLDDLLINCLTKIRGIKMVNILTTLCDIYKVNPSGKDGMIFTIACRHGNLKAVKYMIGSYNVDPNINDEMGFILACRFGYYETARFLVENGANFKAKNCLVLRLLQESKEFGSLDKQWLLNLFR